MQHFSAINRNLRPEGQERVIIHSKCKHTTSYKGLSVTFKIKQYYGLLNLKKATINTYHSSALNFIKLRFSGLQIVFHKYNT